MKLCRKAPRGWRCVFNADHAGPCAGRPAWWNLSGKRWMKVRVR